MATGFSVATIAPFRGGRGALRLGLGALPESDWLDTGPERASRAAAKAAIFATEPDSLAILPEAAPAIAELAALIGTPPTLPEIALATYEDIAILLPEGPSHRLVAAAIAFPTDWDLPAKIGTSLGRIHAPIPTYAEKLERGVDHVFANLAPGRLLTRANWNVVETDELRYLPDADAIDRFGHVIAANAGDTLFVRVERQTLRRLPLSAAALFTIGIYVEPLKVLPLPLQRDLVTAVFGVPDEEAIRRGTPAYRDALAAYVAAATETVTRPI